jgi:hypothetical protein
LPEPNRLLLNGGISRDAIAVINRIVSADQFAADLVC